MWLLLQALCFCWFAMGWYPCNCVTCRTCSHCDSNGTPCRYQIELSGVANNACTECVDFNTTTLILTQSETCAWNLINVDICNSAPNDIYKLEWLVVPILGGFDLRIRNENKTLQATGGSYGFGDPPYDCTQTFSDGGIDFAIYTNATCNWDDAGFTTTPLHPYA